MTFQNPRIPDHAVAKVFVDRWSPRAFSADAISDADLNVILEAARWAPSAYNSQPWRFVVAKRGEPGFDVIAGLLLEGNRIWAKDAAVLIVLVSQTHLRPPGADKDVPSYSHSFDAGAAWANLALQATKLDWRAHAMIGFDMARARMELNVPEDCRVEAAIAIGRIGDKNKLPAPLAARESPNPRRPLSEIVVRGAFPKA